MTIVHGDCTEALKSIASESVDFALTDPPYLVGYRSRDGQTIANDEAQAAPVLFEAFRQIYRVLKPDTLCISFYGFLSIHTFAQAWSAAGFIPVGHVTWPKEYPSSARYFEHRHEAAYVLAKGRPPKPALPLPDVQPWEYTGNRAHPTEKHVDILKPLIEAFTAEGALVLDPFSGSGSTAVAAALSNRRYLAIEIEAKYVRHAEKRLAGVARHLARGP